MKKEPRPEGEGEEAREGEEVEEEDMIRIRTASRGQVRRQVMIVERAEAPRMIGISKTSAEPGPTRSVKARRKNSLKPEKKGGMEGGRECEDDGDLEHFSRAGPNEIC